MSLYENQLLHALLNKGGGYINEFMIALESNGRGETRHQSSPNIYPRVSHPSWSDGHTFHAQVKSKEAQNGPPPVLSL